MTKPIRGLTAKQARFVEEYVACGNGTKAAIKAGYSQRTARAIASETLKKPAVKAAIDDEGAQRRRLSETTAKRVRAELARIAFAEIDSIFDERGNIKDPSTWPKDIRDLVQYRLEERYVRDASGRRRIARRKVSFRMPHKFKALLLLAEHLGMLEPQPPPPS